MYQTLRGGYSNERKKEAREALRKNRLCLERDKVITTQVERLTYGLGQLYGGKLRPLVSQFANAWSATDNIVVVPPYKLEEAEKIVRRYSLSDHGSLVGGISGAYLPDADMILIGDPQGEDATPELKTIISEEWIHAFLAHSSRGKIPLISGVRELVYYIKHKSSDNTRPIQEQLENNNSEPLEQVTKAMVLTALEQAGGYNPFLSFANPKNRAWYRKSAEMGQRRIDELGIDEILKGNIVTNHEKDFTVDAESLEL